MRCFKTPAIRLLFALCLSSLMVLAKSSTVPPRPETFIGVASDGKSFQVAGSAFTPWGFNYDHDRDNRLLEYYWIDEWETVVADFKEMKELGANTVRIHLQVSRFMKSPEELEEKSLEQLDRLLALAEETGLYIDLTGLGCYDKNDVPKWFNDLGETERWNTQALFWEKVAEVCSRSPALFCYDLMNEPILTEANDSGEWTPGAFADRYFVQRLVLEHKGRTREEIAEAWVNKMVAAIRKHDPHHLITLGAIPWAHTWPNAKPLFYSPNASKNLDFVSLHFYPKAGEVDKALKALAVYDIGKPIVIEEIFPLKCSIEELAEFIEGSKNMADGWLGFYWGKSIAEYKEPPVSIAGAITAKWLEYFRTNTPQPAPR